jgi:hypothetical protein
VVLDILDLLFVLVLELERACACGRFVPIAGVVSCVPVGLTLCLGLDSTLCCTGYRASHYYQPRPTHHLSGTHVSTVTPAVATVNIVTPVRNGIAGAFRRQSHCLSPLSFHSLTASHCSLTASLTASSL